MGTSEGSCSMTTPQSDVFQTSFGKYADESSRIERKEHSKCKRDNKMHSRDPYAPVCIGVDVVEQMTKW